MAWPASPGMLSPKPCPPPFSHARMSSSITIHFHSLSPNMPQASVSHISSYGDLRPHESVRPFVYPPPPRPSTRTNHDHVFRIQRETTSPSGVIGQGMLSPSNSRSTLALAQYALDPYLLPAFLRPPGLQRQPLLVCRRRGRDQQPAWARSLSISPTPRKFCRPYDWLLSGTARLCAA